MEIIAVCTVNFQPLKTDATILLQIFFETKITCVRLHIVCLHTVLHPK